MCMMTFTIELDDAKNIWDLLFWSRIETLLVNSGQVAAYPWASLLYSPGSLAGVPSEVRMPESLLAKLEILRTNVEAHFESRIWSMEEMVTHARKNAAELSEHHWSFCIHAAFMQKKAVEVLRSKASSSIHIHGSIWSHMFECLLKS